MGEGPNRLDDRAFEDHLEMYKRYLLILRGVQSAENELSRIVPLQIAVHEGKAQIHSRAPAETHFLGKIEFSGNGAYFVSHPASAAAIELGEERDMDVGIGFDVDSDMKTVIEEFLYILPVKLKEAYEIASARWDAQWKLHDIVEQKNSESGNS